MKTMKKTPKVQAPEPVEEEISIQDKFKLARAAMSTALVERDDEIDLVLTALLAKENPLLVGPPGCLHRDTLIYDPIDGSTLSVSEREKARKPFHVWSLNKEGEVMITKACPPKKYKIAEMLEFTFESGARITVTKGHRFWTGGSFIPAGQLSSGDVLVGVSPYVLQSLACVASVCAPQTMDGCSPLEFSFSHPQSISDIFPSRFHEDGLHCWGTSASFQGDHHSHHHSCDELLREALDISPIRFPLQDGYGERNNHERMDDRGSIGVPYSHHKISHLSTSDSYPQIGIGSRVEFLCFERQGPFLQIDGLTVKRPQLDGYPYRNDKAEQPNLPSLESTEGSCPYLPLSIEGVPEEAALLWGEISRTSLRSLLEIAPPRIQKRKGLCENPSRGSFAYQGNWRSNAYMIEERITSVKEVPSDVYYDFHVPFYENYWAHGVFHHNSGKSLLLDNLSTWVETEPFDYLLTKFTDPMELFGPIDLAALKENDYRRIVDGFLPTVTFAFIDEIWKGSSAILNTLLKILNEKKFRFGQQKMDCPLILCVAASNEWPNDDNGGKELGALFDRFLLRKTVSYVSRAGQRALLTKAIANDECRPVFPCTISPQEIHQAHEEARNLPWHDDAKRALWDILEGLRQQGIIPSDRRKKKAIGVARASAYLHGANEVLPQHLEVLAHVLWDDPEEQPAKCEKVVASIANPLAVRVLEYQKQAQDVEDKAEEALKGMSAAQDIQGICQATVDKLKQIHVDLKVLQQDVRRDKVMDYVLDSIKSWQLRSIGVRRE